MTEGPVNNVITYGNGKQVRYGIHTVFVLDYDELDDIIEVEFPLLNWQGIVAEEEMNNMSEIRFRGCCSISQGTVLSLRSGLS